MGAHTRKMNPLGDLLPQKDEHVSEHAPVQTNKPVQTHRVKELKSHRLQVLMKPSTVSALDEYTQSYGVSRAEIVQSLIEEYLNDPTLRIKIESKLFDR
jgi:hypothetical protein